MTVMWLPLWWSKIYSGGPVKAKQKSIRHENKLTETHSTVLLNAMREKILAKFSFLVMHRQHVQEGLYYLTLGHATPITDF